MIGRWLSDLRWLCKQNSQEGMKKKVELGRREKRSGLKGAGRGRRGGRGGGCRREERRGKGG